MVAHAEIDLRLGGTMKTRYDPKGTIDDAKAIENTILSYEPMRMLSIKVAKAPDTFPFPRPFSAPAFWPGKRRDLERTSAGTPGCDIGASGGTLLRPLSIGLPVPCPQP